MCVPCRLLVAVDSAITYGPVFEPQGVCGGGTSFLTKHSVTALSPTSVLVAYSTPGPDTQPDFFVGVWQVLHDDVATGNNALVLGSIQTMFSQSLEPNFAPFAVSSTVAPTNPEHYVFICFEPGP